MSGKLNLLMSLFIAVLFVVLTPGVLVSLPSKGSLLTKAAVHGVVFAAVFHFTHRAVWRMTTQGFQNMPSANGAPAANNQLPVVTPPANNATLRKA